MPSQSWLGGELRRHGRTMAIQLLVPLFLVLIMRLLGVGPWVPQFAPGGAQDASEPPAAPVEPLPFADL